MGHYDWIDADEYPDDDDIDRFGDDSPPDNDPLTIGYLDDNRTKPWTVNRVMVLLFVLALIVVTFFSVGLVFLR